MKRLIFLLPCYLLLLICLVFSGGLAAHGEDQGDADVRFRWAFGAMVGTEGDRRLVAITRDTTLKTGDQLKMLVELRKNCFVYLIYRSGQDEISLLFPYDIKGYDSGYRLYEKHYIPQGSMWFELDSNIGRETFYLLASAQRLTGLEGLLGSYDAADSAGRPGLAKLILKEIRRIKKSKRTLTSAAQRPVPIGGNVRGIAKDRDMSAPSIDPIAGEVSASNFYSRTFTIEHR